MLLRSKLKILWISLAALLTSGLVVGGYFLFTRPAKNKYQEYYVSPISDSQDSMVSAYYGAVRRGAEVILCPGFSHQIPIEKAFDSYYEDDFKDIAFLLFDSSVNSMSKAASNTWNIQYRTDLGSIQVGIIAAVFLNYYQDIFLNNGSNDNTLTYAMWGGIEIDSVTSFMGGFQKGIEYANKTLNGKSINGFKYKKVTQVFSDNGQEFTGGFGPSDGINTMTQIIKKYPDILMPVAGPQIWTAQDEIEKIGNSKTVLVGVDSAVEEDSKNKQLSFKAKNNKIVGNGKRIQFSSLKNLERSTQIALDIINNGNIAPSHKDSNRYKNFTTNGRSGGIGGIGTTAVGDTYNGCVGASDAGLAWYKNISFSGKPNIVSISRNSEYSNKNNMYYLGYKGKKIFYNNLVQKFELNNNTKDKNLNKKNFIKKGDQADSNKIKIILSTSSSVLLDSSFSQSCYVGLYWYFKSMGINIPPVPSSK